MYSYSASDLDSAVSSAREYQREKWSYAKREETRSEIDAVMRRVDGLESALGALRSENDGLRDRVQELEAALAATAS